MIGDYLHRFGPVFRRFVNMLDGSHAEVVAVGAVSTVVQVTQGEVAPVIRTLEIDAADTEFSIELPANFGFEFKARESAEVRFAFSGDVVAVPEEPYMTLPAGWHFYQQGQFAALTLYFAVGIGLPPVTVEIITLEPVLEEE